MFEKADRLAKKLGKSRSQLYSEAVAEYVGRYGSEDVTEAMNAVCDALDQAPDSFVQAATRNVLKSSEW